MLFVLFLFYNNLLNFIYLFILDALGLCSCAQAFSLVAGSRGYSFHCGAWASHCGGFSCCGAWALGAQASVVVAHRLSCSIACGIFLEQGLNLCPLHWQVGSFYFLFIFLVFFVVVLGFLKHLYWSIVALQWFVSFCFITK